MVSVVVEEEGQLLEQTVETDIRAFEEWFRSQGNDPLVKSEWAILKTYLFFKTRVQGEKHGTQAGG